MSAFAALFERDLFQIARDTGTTTRDANGRLVKTLTVVSTVDGLLQPTGTLEGEAFVVDRFRAIMPLGTDLRAADEVRSRGRVYTVEGTPFEARPPRSKRVGVLTAVLKYVGPTK